MNLMCHTMLDVTDNILLVHYTSMKCDVSFSQGSVSTLFRRGGYNSVKIITTGLAKLTIAECCFINQSIKRIEKGKSKVLPRSLTSVWPGADPGIQAVSSQVTF